MEMSFGQHPPKNCLFFSSKVGKKGKETQMPSGSPSTIEFAIHIFHISMGHATFFIHVLAGLPGHTLPSGLRRGNTVQLQDVLHRVLPDFAIFCMCSLLCFL